MSPRRRDRQCPAEHQSRKYRPANDVLGLGQTPIARSRGASQNEGLHRKAGMPAPRSPSEMRTRTALRVSWSAGGRSRRVRPSCSHPSSGAGTRLLRTCHAGPCILSGERTSSSQAAKFLGLAPPWPLGRTRNPYDNVPVSLKSRRTPVGMGYILVRRGVRRGLWEFAGMVETQSSAGDI